MSVGYRSVFLWSLLLAAGCFRAGEAEEGQDGDASASIGETRQSVEITLDDRTRQCRNDARVVTGTLSLDVCIGGDLFFRETFRGNGRSCATCHRVDRNMTIDTEFMSRLPPNDPLFVAEFNRTLSNLEIPDVMRGHGLILENLDGFSAPTERFVLRSVPHTLSLATSVAPATGDPNPPAERTGWSGDGAPNAGSLRDFQTGAITQHYTRNLRRTVGTDFRLATDLELDRIDKFMRGFGRTNELDLGTVAMADAGAENGRNVFLAVGCNACHANAGANAGFGGGGNRNFNTGVESSRNPELAIYPRDGGFLGAPANLDGSFGDGSFNAPPLIEAADTAPFFHTDVAVTGASAHNTPSVSTIEEAVAFYDSPAFNTSPSGVFAPIDMTAAQIDDVGRFLRGLNATFNAALAIKRLDAATAIIRRFHNTRLAMQRELLRLANVEVQDACDVLYAVPNLNAESQTLLYSALINVTLARTTGSETTRLRAITDARAQLVSAAAKVGTNLTYQIGDAVVMF